MGAALHLAHVHQQPARRRKRKRGGPGDGDGPFLIVPRDACEACLEHWHHKCWGVNILLDPIPDCPCDCGDRKDPMRLSPQAWADMALHAPDQVWVAAMFERQRAGGIHMCVMDDEERHRAFKEQR